MEEEAPVRAEAFALEEDEMILLNLNREVWDVPMQYRVYIPFTKYSVFWHRYQLWHHRKRDWNDRHFMGGLQMGWFGVLQVEKLFNHETYGKTRFRVWPLRDCRLA